LRAHGLSPRGAYLQRRSVAADFGDRDMAREADRELRRYPPPNPGSAGREAAWQIEYHLFLGDAPAAAAVADAHFPRPGRAAWLAPWVASLSLLPLLRVGRRAAAGERYPAAAGRPSPPGNAGPGG